MGSFVLRVKDDPSKARWSLQMFDKCFLVVNLMRKMMIIHVRSSFSLKTIRSLAHQRRLTSGKGSSASDISKKLIGRLVDRMRKQFLLRSWLASSGRTNHIWQNNDFLSRANAPSVIYKLKVRQAQVSIENKSWQTVTIFLKLDEVSVTFHIVVF